MRVPLAILIAFGGVSTTIVSAFPHIQTLAYQNSTSLSPTTLSSPPFTTTPTPTRSNDNNSTIISNAAHIEISASSLESHTPSTLPAAAHIEVSVTTFATTPPTPPTPPIPNLAPDTPQPTQSTLAEPVSNIGIIIASLLAGNPSFFLSAASAPALASSPAVEPAAAFTPSGLMAVTSQNTLSTVAGTFTKPTTRLALGTSFAGSETSAAGAAATGTAIVEFAGGGGRVGVWSPMGMLGVVGVGVFGGL
ncbi:hypothetical protein K432DRAFT_426799 [Lepidopterella palustris CBS 459.81]|uniref:Uncharacterized protein n=1 Tax=Lepidopterella palustris CBS 459.81 TaxID=1314670 RepID=A0A8E2E7X3_9PEZI|nr:hypothetical protein K432DRAFT_426799 [Lepidopterella palustris CBS 459.81]